MITYYSLLLLSSAVIHVNTQYLLAEYAPKHDNYEPARYSFAYGVSDPHTGDHKHHWETREGDNVKGEYGLLEPDGVTRIVQYTSDPHHGFQAIVRRLHIPPEQYTSGQVLYGIRNGGLYNYNSNNQNQASEGETDHGAIGGENGENKQEEEDNHFGNEDASSENAYVKVGDVIDCVKKQIVKKNNAETHFSYPSSIEEIQSSANENQEVLHTNLRKENVDNSQQENQNVVYGFPLRYGQPEIQKPHYTNTLQTINQNIPNVVAITRRVFEEFPNHNIHEDVFFNNYNNHQSIPETSFTSPGYPHKSHLTLLPQSYPYSNNQGVSPSSKVYSNNENSQSLIPIISYQNEFGSDHATQISQVPQINTENVQQISNSQLDVTSSRKNLAQQNEYPIILVDTNAKFGFPFYPHTQVNGLFQLLNGQMFGYEGIPLSNANVNNEPQNNNANINNNNNNINTNAQNNERNIQRRVDNIFSSNDKINKNIPAGTTLLHGSNSIPNNIYNFQFHGLSSVPQTDQSINNYQEKSGQGSLTNGNSNYPPGSTRETIWNAGDPTADRDVEVLVRQLNETCAYFQFNETSPSTEDGSRPNIFNAGDYSAQREETELIRSVNITCDNFTTDALNNFTSGFTLAQYCSQCYQNESDESNNDNNYDPNSIHDFLNNFNIPTNFEGNQFWVPSNIFHAHFLNNPKSDPFQFDYEQFVQNSEDGNEGISNIYKRSREKRYEEKKPAEEKSV